MAKDYVTINVLPETRRQLNTIAKLNGVTVYELVAGMALRDWREQGLDKAATVAVETAPAAEVEG